jgi:hypothetical protein
MVEFVGGRRGEGGNIYLPRTKSYEFILERGFRKHTDSHIKNLVHNGINGFMSRLSEMGGISYDSKERLH